MESPYPENLPVVNVCKQCNSGFASDEEYLIAFLGSVLSGSASPNPDLFPKAAGILTHSPRLRGRIARSRTVQGTLWGETEILWEPELARIERVTVKNARGHVLYEMSEPMFSKPSCVRIGPLSRLDARQRDQFEDIPSSALWPEIGSRMMHRACIRSSLRDPGEIYFDGWQYVQDGVYRYAVALTAGRILVRTVLYEYLATEVCWDEPGIV